MQIIYWKNFSKRVNSTLAPSGAGTTIDVVLKDNCTIESPAFILNSVDFEINYIQAFGRYYFVDQIVNLDGHRTMYVCNQDDLATYKADIQASSAMVLYSSSNYNVHLPDPRIAVSNDKTVSDTIATPQSSIVDPSSGYYVLGCVKTGATKFTQFYVTGDGTGLASIAADMLDGNSNLYNDLSQFFLGKPFDAIFSLVWVPIALNVASQGCSSISCVIGNTPMGFHLLEPTSHVLDIPVAVSFSNTYTDFTDCEPYKYASINLPFYGLVPIKISDFIVNGEAPISIGMRIDIITGTVLYKIMNKNGDIISEYSANAGVQLPISSSAVNIQSFASNATGAVAGLLTGNVMGAVGNVVSAISNITKPEIGMKGAQGGYSTLLSPLDFHLITSKQKIADYNSSTYVAKQGRPLGVVRSLSGLSGYVQTEGASVGSAATESENLRINSALNSGIYIE